MTSSTTGSLYNNVLLFLIVWLHSPNALVHFLFIFPFILHWKVQLNFSHLIGDFLNIRSELYESYICADFLLYKEGHLNNLVTNVLVTCRNLLRAKHCSKNSWSTEGRLLGNLHIIYLPVIRCLWTIFVCWDNIERVISKAVFNIWSEFTLRQ